MDLASLRKTTDDKPAGILRLLLAGLLVIAGSAKLVVPELAD